MREERGEEIPLRRRDAEGHLEKQWEEWSRRMGIEDVAWQDSEEWVEIYSCYVGGNLIE